jgi:hypothetical protein
MNTTPDQPTIFELRTLNSAELTDINGGAKAIFLPPPASARSIKMDPYALPGLTSAGETVPGR